VRRTIPLALKRAEHFSLFQGCLSLPNEKALLVPLDLLTSHKNPKNKL